MASLVQGVRSVIARSTSVLRVVAPRANGIAIHHQRFHSSRLSAVTLPSLLHNAQVKLILL